MDNVSDKAFDAEQMIAGLTRLECQSLHSTLTKRLAITKPTSQAPPREIIYYDALAGALADVTLGTSRASCASYSDFRVNYGSRRVTAAFSIVDAFLERACGGVIMRPRRLEIARKCFICLAQNLIERDIPPSAQSMLNGLALLHWAVDAQYPGYASARLLHRIAL